MKKHMLLAGLGVLGILVFLLYGYRIVSKKTTGDKIIKSVANFKLTENKDIYKNDNDNSVEDIYLTIVKEPNNNFAKINAYKFDWINKIVKPEVKVVFSTKKDISSGVSDQYNAIIKPRGRSSSHAEQASIKINLMDNAGLWHNRKTLNLNKHPYDMSRIKNKLSFDYFKEMPDFFSLRTQFCHLYIRDLNASNNGYVDYGLFTDIESVNSEYFKTHQIMDSGYVYKANQFEFIKDPNLKNVNDKGYDEKKFENVLGIKLSAENKVDHSRLLDMLNDVNNINMGINDVINKHFDRENYLTWLATNILIGNIDTNSQNFFLVSPVTSDKWYFMPWDYDAAWNNWKMQGSYASWQKEGISNYWGVVLHKRFFKDPNNIKELSNKIEELSTMFTESKTKGMLEKYRQVTEKLVKSNPDLQYLPTTPNFSNPIEYYEADFKNILDTVRDRKAAYYKGLENPMPIYLGDVEKKNEECVFSWDDSYDLNAYALTYSLKISTTPDMNNIVYQNDNLTGTSLSVKGLNLGETYYWTVIVRNKKGNTQIPFDILELSKDKFFGVKQFDFK